jgi:putative redox protein
MLPFLTRINQLGGCVEVSLNWAGGVAFVGRTAAGHVVVMDGAPEGGGRDLGPRPMETLLLGMGGCASYDVVVILRKGRADIADCKVDIRATRAEQDPKVFTDIHLHFTVTGRGLTERQVERAIHLSAEKYCSASIMLAKTARITHSFEIREADPGT